MKEQVIASRAPRRGNAQAKGLPQRPMRRDGRTVESDRFSMRSLYAYVPRALKVAVVILGIIGLAIGYRAASSAALFQARAVDVVGTSRTSAEEIESLVRRSVSRTGVWRADLSALSVELGRLPGVRRAVITRVLPDGLRVRITERVPVAVVRTAAGHFVSVDDEGVALGEMKSDQMPPFFIRGWNEDGTNEARQENSERVKKYQEALREWQTAGVAERVSEISLFDVHDVRAQLAGKDSDIEVRLGSRELGRRLKEALDVLDEYKQTPRGSSITYADYQGDHVLLGFSSGAKVSAGSDDNAGEPSDVAANAGAAATAATRNAEPGEKPVDKKPRVGAQSTAPKPTASPRSAKRPTANRNG
ncbi:MAG TPA: FtsQ-type POTRA domain-containing protein [Pyrinomonadaceae bacterium]